MAVMAQLEERILQIDQLKNASKRLQPHIDCIHIDQIKMAKLK